MNVPWILVRRRPRIAIIATGDEIVRPGELTSKNQIVSSNSYTLHAFLTALGADVQILGVAPDDTDAIGLLAKEAEGSDLLVTTGGASVGKHDLIQEALSAQKFGKNALKLNFGKSPCDRANLLSLANCKRNRLLGYRVTQFQQ